MKVATFTRLNYKYKPIDELPFPDYEPWGGKDMVDSYSMATRLLYRYSRPYPRPFIIVASRSCPFRCTFCQHSRGARYRARSIENIMAELKVMYDRYKFNVLIILDELFAVNNTRMNEFCGAILEGKEKYNWDFDWMFQTHASAKFDKGALDLAKQAGCFFFSYGLESASPIILKSMNKKIKVEQVIEAIKLARDAKLGFSANLIFGDIAETEETWAESLAFWLEYGQSSFIFLGKLSPYPGSKLYDDCVKKGLIKDKKQYYETIDEKPINMTAIPDHAFAGLLSLIDSLESAWLFVKPADNVHCEKEVITNGNKILSYSGNTMRKIEARCPYCGEKSLYRQSMPDATQKFFIGTGCTHCNQRMKVEVR